MPDVPESLISAMKAAGVDADAVLAEVDQHDPIPSDEWAVADQQGDWRSQMPDEPEPTTEDLAETEREMIQPSLLDGDGQPPPILPSMDDYPDS